jgi:cyclohexyl-isocyanide hydratase
VYSLRVKAGILVFEGVEELDFVGVLETLGVTRRISSENFFEVSVLGVEEGPVKCANGLVVTPQGSMEHLLDQDVIVVPGGRGILNLLGSEAVMQVLRDAHDRVKIVASVCTGSVVLGKAGLLRGKRATTHHLHFDELLAHSPGVVPVREKVVVDGKIVTGAGISSSLDTGLTIIELIFGKDHAQGVARRIEYAR